MWLYFWSASIWGAVMVRIGSRCLSCTLVRRRGGFVGRISVLEHFPW